jgi:hypothetical protein
MKSKFKTVLVVFILLIVVIIIYFVSQTRETKDWDFIQKVGGIKTEQPYITEDGYYLPLKCNVSGTDSVTRKPTMVNSSMSCLKIKSTVNGNAIHLKVIAGIPLIGKSDCNCKSVQIGELKPGKYNVYYGDESSFEHPIGVFEIK